MHTTTMLNEEQTRGVLDQPTPPPNSLFERYQELIHTGKVQWTTYHRLEREMGSGGQGVVYLSRRNGADGFTLPVAMKVFSPERFPSVAAYVKTMERLARVASRVAMIQQDNVLDVQDFVDRDSIRVMIMEWIDG